MNEFLIAIADEYEKFYCDICKHRFLAKDIAIVNDTETLCKCCHDDGTPYLMDNLSVRYFESSKKAHTMMCVLEFDNKLQMSIRAYGLGLSVIFPAMSKEELVYKWLGDSTEWNDKEISLLFGSAMLRIIPDYITREEIRNIRDEWYQQLMKEK
ncbi:hypothetical protein [Paenibacillus sp. FSL L8-0709]|uniref:hypothetical protein n=1 Tax=Paenibacillus sp. FSL L8-0709 TaxID=2975312 RepID=UPI0030FB69B5